MTIDGPAPCGVSLIPMGRLNAAIIETLAEHSWLAFVLAMTCDEPHEITITLRLVRHRDGRALTAPATAEHNGDKA